MCLHYQFPPSQRFHSPCFFPAFGPNDCVILTPSFFILRVDLGIKMSQREYHRMCERIAHSNSWLGNWGWIPLRSFKSRSVPLFQIHPYLLILIILSNVCHLSWGKEQGSIVGDPHVRHWGVKGNGSSHGLKDTIDTGALFFGAMLFC